MKKQLSARGLRNPTLAYHNSDLVSFCLVISYSNATFLDLVVNMILNIGHRYLVALQQILNVHSLWPNKTRDVKEK